MNGEASIRSAVAADAAALARLAERTFADAFGALNTPENMALHRVRSYGEEIQRREILDPSRSTFVAESSGELVAYFQLAWGAAPAAVFAANPVEILRFYVDSAWHGRGLAQRLMATALAAAGERLADVVWLGVWEENPRGIAFYRKCGFTAVGRQTFLVGDDPQRDLVMSRPVAGSGGSAAATG